MIKISMQHLYRKLDDKDKYTTLIDFDKVFGLRLDQVKEEKVDISKEVQDLVNQREKARKDKNWELADGLRDKIKELGFQIEDSDEGLKFKKL